MRLKDFEVQAIKDAVNSMDRDAVVYLFGSRVDDNKRGGDIDLVISSDKISEEDIFKIKLKIFKHLDRQKIDIIITDKNNNPKYNKDKIFYKVIDNQRIEL